MQIDTVPRGAVLFITGPRMLNAYYGGLMSTRAHFLGAAGAVVDGRIRDLSEHRRLGFPVSLLSALMDPSDAAGL